MIHSRCRLGTFLIACSLVGLCCNVVIFAYQAPTPFDLLGLKPNPILDKTAIKTAYKRMALRFHPDIVVNQQSTVEEKQRANDNFAKINGAYEILMGRLNNVNEYTAGHARQSPSGYSSGAHGSDYWSSGFNSPTTPSPSNRAYGSSYQSRAAYNANKNGAAPSPSPSNRAYGSSYQSRAAYNADNAQGNYAGGTGTSSSGYPPQSEPQQETQHNPQYGYGSPYESRGAQADDGEEQSPGYIPQPGPGPSTSAYVGSPQEHYDASSSRYNSPRDHRGPPYDPWSPGFTEPPPRTSGTYGMPHGPYGPPPGYRATPNENSYSPPNGNPYDDYVNEYTAGVRSSESTRPYGSSTSSYGPSHWSPGFTEPGRRSSNGHPPPRQSNTRSTPSDGAPSDDFIMTNEEFVKGGSRPRQRRAGSSNSDRSIYSTFELSVKAESRNNDENHLSLLETGTLQEISEEVENSELLIQQLSSKLGDLESDVIESDAKALKCTGKVEKWMKLQANVAELEEQMGVLDGHIEKIRYQVSKLQRRHKELIIEQEDEEDDVVEHEHANAESNSTEFSGSSFGSDAPSSSTSTTQDNKDSSREMFFADDLENGPVASSSGPFQKEFEDALKSQEFFQRKKRGFKPSRNGRKGKAMHP